MARPGLERRCAATILPWNILLVVSTSPAQWRPGITNDPATQACIHLLLRLRTILASIAQHIGGTHQSFHFIAAVYGRQAPAIEAARSGIVNHSCLGADPLPVMAQIFRHHAVGGTIELWNR